MTSSLTKVQEETLIALFKEKLTAHYPDFSEPAKVDFMILYW
jgi:hypothetical protein